MQDETISKIIAPLTFSPGDPAAWTAALDEVSLSVDAQGGLLLPLVGRDPGVPCSVTIRESATAYFADGWAPRDGRIPGIPKLLRDGILVDQDFISPEQMDKSPFWNELLRPHNLRWFCGLRINAAGDIWCAAFQRSPSQGVFTEAEQLKLSRLIDPLSRQATFAHEFGRATLLGLAEGLDLLHKPAIVVARDLKVVQTNHRADRICVYDYPVSVDSGYLTVYGSRTVTGKLRRHLEAILWRDVSPTSPDLKPVVVNRDGRRPLVVQAFPRSVSNWTLSNGAAVVIITDPELVDEPSRAILISALDLTNGEARVALAAAMGSPVPAIAQQLGISYETARSHMKSIFVKAGVRSGGELVALLSRLLRS